MSGLGIEKQVDSIREQMLPFFRLGEENTEYVLSGSCYEWYYTYAVLTRPGRVLEIGVRYGYSAIALLLGWPAVRELVLIDDGSYGVTINESLAAIRCVAPAVDVRACMLNTQSVNHLPASGEFDLVHVDGDHTYYGAFHDLSLVAPLMSPTGLIVLDDVDYIPRVARAARDFMAHHREFVVTYVPTYRGHYLLHRRDGPPGFRRKDRRPKRRERSIGTATAWEAQMTSDADSKELTKESEEINRRQFFKAAGRGSTALGSMIILGGAGLTMLSASCGGDDITGTNGY